MPKISKGRMDSVYGMSKFSAEELFKIADEYENNIKDPNNTDDPKWLQRRADRIRALAQEKEKSLEHKANQNK